MDNIVTVSDSDDNEEDANLPSREECEERCQMFAEVTGTDTALAMFYLQDRDWSVERSISDFLADKEGNTAGAVAIPGKAAATTSPKTQKISEGNPTKTQGDVKAKTSKENSSLMTAPPLLQPENENRIRVLSWNIDGLDPQNLESRTEGACSVLMQERPEVIFLQEVVDRSIAIIEKKCDAYKIFAGIDDQMRVPGAYYTAMLLRKDCVQVELVNVADFPSSLMSRNLLEVQCKVKDIPMNMMTSHLESTADHSEERRKQLKISFDRMLAIPADRTVIFGGDLNLREKELKGVTVKPPGVYDMWECTGKRPEAKFTWDLTINDNKQISAKFQPRCRFDRLFVRHSKETKVKPVYFELVGIQRLSSCRRFPSDHWGILAHLDIKGK